MQNNNEHLLQSGGGYRKLKSFILSRMCYDITVRFTELFLAPADHRMKDQMVQAARSGVQNIAEGSVASITSKETELKLTNVARASLEELFLDYEDYLRQRQQPCWDLDNPFRMEFVRRRISSNRAFHEFIDWVMVQPGCQSKDIVVANATLLLLGTAKFFLKRQLARLSEDFTNQGGFRERMSNFRRQQREGNK